jgi:hypothetical protein
MTSKTHVTPAAQTGCKRVGSSVVPGFRQIFAAWDRRPARDLTAQPAVRLA